MRTTLEDEELRTRDTFQDCLLAIERDLVVLARRNQCRHMNGAKIAAPIPILDVSYDGKLVRAVHHPIGG